MGVSLVENGAEDTSHLLRRPRPPKQVFRPPSQGDDPPSPRDRAVTFRFDSSHSRSTPVARRQRHRSLPVHCDFSKADIEQAVNDRTNFVIHPIRPKGPEFFPPGKPLRAVSRKPLDPLDHLPDEIHLGSPRHEFTFNDFRIHPDPDRPPMQISGGMMSRLNYLKLTSWFATHAPKQENMNTVDLQMDQEAAPGRVPRGHILIGKLVIITSKFRIKYDYSIGKVQV